MSQTQHDVLCVGILVADLFVPPIPHLPAEGELLRVDDMLLTTGGCAANTGADLARLGARTAIVGKVGNDAFAGFIRQELEAKGCDVSGIRASLTRPTSRTVILPVIGQDRRYIHAVGANAELNAGDVDLDQVSRSRVLYVGGYQLCPALDQAALAQLFQFARARGVKTVLDVAGVRPDRGLEPFEQVLPHTDVFLPNDDEARAITGQADPMRQADIFVRCGAGIAIVTLGAQGAVARTRDRAWQAGAFQVEVVDPSGGGDAFDAGFIIGLLEGWDVPQSLAFASAIGASACTALGCTAGVFTREQAIAYLASHPIDITAS